MQISPKTKQRVYLFVEKEHGWLSTRFVSVLMETCLLALQAPKSIRALVREEVLSGDFKTPIRRVNWLLAYSRFRRSLFSDQFFDFSLGLEQTAAKEMLSRLKKLAEPQFQDHVHIAQLASRVIESQLQPGNSIVLSDDASLAEFDRQYQSHLEQALSLIQLEGREGVAEMPDETPHAIDSRAAAKSSQAFSGSTLAQTVFDDVIEFMDEHQPGVYAISGTLLGIIRENKLLSHDVDIDLGVMAEALDADRVISAINASDTFYIKKIDYPVFRNLDGNTIRYSRMSMPSLIKFGHKRGLHIDLFVHFDDAGVRWHGSSLHRWDNSDFDIDKMAFMGREVNIPSNPERYLQENYGDWETPKIDFNCSVDTPNIALQSSCKTICYFVKLLHFYQAEPGISFRILNLLRTQDTSMPQHLA